MKCNYHTHCLYCDGTEKIEKYVERAIDENLDHLGFSSHAPLRFENSISISENKIDQYHNEILNLQKIDANIRLYCGLECDFIPGFTYEFAFFKEKYHLDYIIGAIHLVKPTNRNDLWFIDGKDYRIYDEGLYRLFDNNIQKAVTSYWEQTFEMIETQNFDILAHCDKIKMHNQNRYFSEDEKWYLTMVNHAIELVKKKDIILEINTRGIYKGRCNDFYPSDYILAKAAQMDIPFVISSDAHKSSEITLYTKEAREKLIQMGISRLAVLEKGTWQFENL